MKKLIFFFTFLILSSCNIEKKKNNPKNISYYFNNLKNENPDGEIKIQYSDFILELFLDSIGSISLKQLGEEITYMPDSIFENRKQINKRISINDFNLLKEAAKTKIIDYQTASKIFNEGEYDSLNFKQGDIPITMYSFDENQNDFKEFALIVGSNFGRNCELYFFKSNQLLSKHNIYHHSGLVLEHYKDNDGKTIIYYKENYISGTGIWWYNFNFYKYYDNKLTPILNEIKNANLQSPWGIRVQWLESFVVDTNPLTLKMVYSQEFSDTLINSSIIKDSTFIEYHWNNDLNKLIGNYKESKISKNQILSFYISDNELLFIKAYNKLLKTNLNKKEHRKAILNYLNEVKNHESTIKPHR